MLLLHLLLPAICRLETNWVLRLLKPSHNWLSEWQLPILSVFVLLQHSKCVFHVNTWTPPVDLVARRRPIRGARSCKSLDGVARWVDDHVLCYHGSHCGMMDDSIRTYKTRRGWHPSRVSEGAGTISRILDQTLSLIISLRFSPSFSQNDCLWERQL